MLRYEDDMPAGVLFAFRPSAVLAIVLLVFQRIFLSRWVFRDRDYPNITVTIDNR